MGGGEVGSEGGWTAGGGLNPPLGSFGLAMVPRSASYRPKHAQGTKRRITITGVNFRPMVFMYIVPSCVPLSQL